jgi:hypothetical protein
MALGRLMTFDEWLQYGLTQGWCGPSICETHDGMPMTIEEEDAYEGGEDPCIHILRLYDSQLEKAEVEKNHSPSIWRATNSGYEL